LPDQAIAMPLLGTPGKRFTYASVNYTLLAMIIEQVSGKNTLPTWHTSASCRWE
jgi:CubicO group peptidase (beta-lactamase class C family)